MKKTKKGNQSLYLLTYLQGFLKNALLTLEANISGLKAPIVKSKTSFENYMFSAFILAQEQVNSIPAPLRWFPKSFVHKGY